MLTVDYTRLGLRPGDRLLDLGCGFGRHAYEGFRRGARVVACDLASEELQQVRAMFEAMVLGGEAPPQGMADCVVGDATRLPYPDGTFDRIIASEVMEHIPDDAGALAELFRVLRPGGTLAVTIPSWLPEKICWALSDEYYTPKSVGGHVRIYTEVGMRGKMRDAGLVPCGAHHAHALHSPYWWLRCAVGPRVEDHALVTPYRKFLEWDIAKAPLVNRLAERLLSPAIGKSLVVYARKPIASALSNAADTGAGTAIPTGTDEREAVGV